MYFSGACQPTNYRRKSQDSPLQGWGQVPAAGIPSVRNRFGNLSSTVDLLQDDDLVSVPDGRQPVSSTGMSISLHLHSNEYWVPKYIRNIPVLTTWLSGAEHL